MRQSGTRVASHQTCPFCIYPAKKSAMMRLHQFDPTMELTSAEASTSLPQACPHSHHQPGTDQMLLLVRLNETLSSSATSLSTSRVITRRRQLALLKAIARCIHRCRLESLVLARGANETLQCGEANRNQCSHGNDADNVGSIVHSSRASINSMVHPGPSYFWVFHHFQLAQLLYRLSSVVERPISASFMLSHNPSIQSITSTQIGQAPSISTEEMTLPNRANLLRQQGIWSSLFMHRLDGGILESSLSLRMLTDGNAGPNRLLVEDILILSQLSLYHLPDPHDQHEDMRMDVDNMSYEELLALEDRIGNVNTGLAEAMVTEHLKCSKCVLSTENDLYTESCSICQEEYVEEDEVGTLDCDHYFHVSCIKQWLQSKNICPICKSTGLTTSNA